MTTLDYDILKFFFVMRTDIKLFKSENADERINIKLPKSKHKLYSILDRLINDGYLQISDSNYVALSGIVLSDVIDSPDKYNLEITEYGGIFMEKLFKIAWAKYCNIGLLYLNDKMLHIVIEMHPKKKTDVVKLLKNIVEKYNVKEIENWSPVYWKRLEKGVAIDFNILAKDYWDFLNNKADSVCNHLW